MKCTCGKTLPRRGKLRSCPDCTTVAEVEGHLLTGFVERETTKSRTIPEKYQPIKLVWRKGRWKKEKKRRSTFSS